MSLLVRSVCEQDNSGCRPNVVGMREGWRCRSDSFLVLIRMRCGCRINCSLSLTLTDMNFFYNILLLTRRRLCSSLIRYCILYVQSPEGDNATALVEFALFECSLWIVLGLRLRNTLQTLLFQCSHCPLSSTTNSNIVCSPDVGGSGRLLSCVVKKVSI